MKNFLKKMPVFITFLSLAVVMLVVWIAMVARPVSYGWGYKGTENGVDTVFTLNSDHTYDLYFEDTDTTESAYFFRRGYKVKFSEAMSEDEYEELKKTYDAFTSEQLDEFYADSIKVNAFRFSSGTVTYTCTGAIVFASVAGVIEVALITFATLSTVFFIRSRKGKKQPVETVATEA